MTFSHLTFVVAPAISWDLRLCCILTGIHIHAARSDLCWQRGCRRALTRLIRPSVSHPPQADQEPPPQEQFFEGEHSHTQKFIFLADSDVLAARFSAKAQWRR